MKHAALGFTLLMLGALGCSSQPSYTYYGEYVDAAPPQPYLEEVPAPPSPSHVWVPGYWYWSGMDYVWVPGRYAIPPASGHIYVRSGWVYHRGGYRYVRGYWAPSTYRVRHTYVHRYPPPRRATTYRAVRRR